MDYEPEGKHPVKYEALIVVVAMGTLVAVIAAVVTVVTVVIVFVVVPTGVVVACTCVCDNQ